MKPQAFETIRKVLKQVGVIAFFTLAGLGVGVLLRRLDFNPGPLPALSIPQVILIGLAAIYLVLLTHELGHLLAGKLAGMRPFLLITGPLKVFATQNGLQIGLNRNLSLAGGLAACLPRTTDNLRRQLLIMAAGGPLTSLLGGVVGMGLFFLLPPESLWKVFGLLFGVTALAIFIATSIPGKTAGFQTDGGQILSLLRGGADVEQRALLVILQAESLQGVRPREWSADILRRLLKMRATPMLDAAAQLMNYYHALDSNDPTRAEESLRTLLQNEAELPEGLKQAVYLEQAFFLALYREDTNAADTFFRKSAGALVEKSTLLRAEAALLFAQGQRDQARQKAEQAIRHASQSFDRGAAVAEREWLQPILSSPS
ncbi:MAG: hypothetical protein N2117_03925 [Anaerolineales bacterium]|nr:hypothetical protein [Anaerolineales bacterium]MCX7754379.1 hypothetical protein [Anaerolineales bacterium]MDW8277901.1 hypothetical protein [Anaerolineales bacterium]